MDLGAIAMKGYSVFPKAPALLEAHYQIVFMSSRTIVQVGGDILPFYKDAVGVFYSRSQLH